MKYRRLGGSGLKVSEISLGSWLTYGGYVERENAVNSIKTAYDLGINFFDTANVYEKGAAEELVGEALKAYPRESYVLATKAFWPMGDGPNDRGLSRKHITEQVHASLKRLKHDYVDIFYCHRHDPETPLEETLRAIDDLIRQGKVLYAGVSEWQASQIAEALGVADRYLLDRIVVNQPQYNMFHRYIEKEIMPLCERSGIGQVVFSPLAQGLLTGKYTSASDIPQAAARQGSNGCAKASRKKKSIKSNSLKASPRSWAFPWATWRWPGFCGAATWRARSLAPAVRSRSRKTRKLPAWN
ncbi:L-glyceraldehyde 3-phosphate reductase [Paenibacillus sp. P1XP2]|nr:L-glyceraldehyde 3-phosphate reductase [Paenibacillus sp. P1XP2]